jgi:hypothetical protein
LVGLPKASGPANLTGFIYCLERWLIQDVRKETIGRTDGRRIDDILTYSCPSFLATWSRTIKVWTTNLYVARRHWNRPRLCFATARLVLRLSGAGRVVWFAPHRISLRCFLLLISVGFGTTVVCSSTQAVARRCMQRGIKKNKKQKNTIYFFIYYC